MMQGLNPNGKLQMVKVDADGKLVVTGIAGGGGGGSGTSDTTEATQLLVKTAVQSLDTKTPALVGGKVPVEDGAQRGAGSVTSATQRVTLGSDDTAVLSLSNIDSAAGAKADAAASSDSGTFSIIALIKRGLGNWTTLLARVPTLGRKTAAGSIPVTLPTDVPTDLVADSAGTLFSPSSCSHAYGYDGSGNLTTDTATDGAVVRVKTLTYTSGNMTAETKWVVQ